ncbi:hypothetical protein CZ771_05520 [Actinomycetales bacterium JB111]|nr:hypothetical protein CZ771_05520 [Actinomycetales bacterium JB111]
MGERDSGRPGARRQGRPVAPGRASSPRDVGAPHQRAERKQVTPNLQTLQLRMECNIAYLTGTMQA